MSSTVLVTGATGKTGRRLVPLLLARGVDVRAAGRNPPAAGAGVEPVRFDWLDERTYAGALRGVNAVYLVNANLSGETTDANSEVKAFLEVAEAAGVGRVVLLSSFGVDQAPETDGLRRTEILVETCGIPGTVLRPGAFMQNFSEDHWTRMVEDIRDRDEIMMPAGDTRLSFVSTEDIAAVAAVTLTEDGHEGAGYTLTGPEALTFAEVAEHISRARGREVRFVDAPPHLLRDRLLAYGASPEFAEYGSALFTTAVTTGAMAMVTPDVTAVTGHPPTTFADFATTSAPAWTR